MLLVFWVQTAVLFNAIIIFIIIASLSGDNGESVLERTPELCALLPEAFHKPFVIIETILFGLSS